MSQITARRKTKNIYLHGVDQPVVAPSYRPHITLTHVAQRRRLPTRVVHVYSIPPPISAPPHGKILVQNAPRRPRPPAERVYIRPTFTAAAAPSDYKPHITVQDAPQRARRLTRNIYAKASFTTAAAPPDYRPNIFVQVAKPPRRRRVFPMVVSRLVPQVVVVAPDRRPQIFVQLAPQPRRRPGAVTQTAGLPVLLSAGWRRPFIQTARAVRRRGRVLIGRVIPFVAPSGGASPPITTATTMTGTSGRTGIAGTIGATSVTGASGILKITGTDGETDVTGSSGRTG